MYKLDSYKEPFWAENSGFITGRDPLGIQNSSTKIKVDLFKTETIALPISFIVGVSFISGSITGSFLPIFFKNKKVDS